MFSQKGITLLSVGAEAKSRQLRLTWLATPSRAVATLTQNGVGVLAPFGSPVRSMARFLTKRIFCTVSNEVQHGFSFFENIQSGQGPTAPQGQSSYRYRWEVRSIRHVKV